MGQSDYDATNAPILNEQIGPTTQHHERHLVFAAQFQRGCQVGFRRRFQIEIGRPADPQGGFFGQRFVPAHNGRRRDCHGQRRGKLFAPGRHFFAKSGR